MNKSKTFIVVLIIIAMCSLPFLAYLWFESSIVKPYSIFHLEEVTAIPKFDKLNKNIADNLPPLPTDIHLENEYSNGIDGPVYLHGRYLYLFLKGPISKQPENISEYYRTYLSNKGWSEIVISTSSDSYLDRYFRNTSCLEVDTYGVNLTGQYQITIWHDFRNQAFSPSIPNQFFMGFFEVGKTFFAECPGPPA